MATAKVLFLGTKESVNGTEFANLRKMLTYCDFHTCTIGSDVVLKEFKNAAPDIILLNMAEVDERALKSISVACKMPAFQHTPLICEATPSEEYFFSSIVSCEICKVLDRPASVKSVEREMKALFNSCNMDISIGKRQVLVVDDDPMVCNMVKSYLAVDYKVTAVESGFEAIGYLESHKPDVLLLDYEMPACNGRQVLEMIRGNAKTKELPVFFLTGVADEEKIIEIMALHPQGYLLKPVNRSLLLGRLEDFFDEQR